MKAKPTPHDIRPLSPGRKKAPRPELSVEQIAWLKKSYRLYGNRALADKLNIKITQLKEIMKVMNISKKSERVKVRPSLPVVEKPAVVKESAPKEIIREARPVKFVRPPAVYGNRSHEETINYYLNL